MSYPGEKTSQPPISAYPLSNEGSLPVAQGVYTVDSGNDPLASQIPIGQMQHYEQTMGPTAPPLSFSQADQNRVSYQQPEINQQYQQSVVNYPQQQQQYQQTAVNYPQQQQQYQQTVVNYPQQQQQYQQTAVNYPQQQQQYQQTAVNYSQQQQQYQQPTKNYSQQQNVIVINSKRDYGHVKTQFTCPYCGYRGFTQTRTVSGACTWLSCIGLAACCWVCCWVPFCTDCTKDTEHYCPNCKTTVATKTRL